MPVAPKKDCKGTGAIPKLILCWGSLGTGIKGALCIDGMFDACDADDGIQFKPLFEVVATGISHIFWG